MNLFSEALALFKAALKDAQIQFDAICEELEREHFSKVDDLSQQLTKDKEEQAKALIKKVFADLTK